MKTVRVIQPRIGSMRLLGDNKENLDEFALENIVTTDIFAGHKLLRDSDLRLILDRVYDYRLLQQVYNQFSRDERGIVDIVEAVEYIDGHDLDDLNKHVQQRDPSTEHA